MACNENKYYTSYPHAPSPGEPQASPGFCPAGLRFRSILVKTHIITVGPQPVADSVPGQGGAVLAPGVSVQHGGEAGDHRDQQHQHHRGQHGGQAGQLGFS